MSQSELKELKDYLLTSMAQLRDHQEKLTEIGVSLDAAIEVLRANPSFASAYTDALESPDRDEARTNGEAVLHRIQAAIARLEKE